MQLSTRRPRLAPGVTLCLMAGSILMSVLVVPADAQTYMPYWSPNTVEVLESAGEVVLTLKHSGPGHVVYQTEDGACPDSSGPCSSQAAKAPADYQAVKGEEIFSSGAESKTIRIPIVDDGLVEESEAFSVYAHTVDRKAVAVVWIVDDDSSQQSSNSSLPAGTSRQSGGSQSVPSSQPRPMTSTAPSPSGSGNSETGSSSVDQSDAPSPGDTNAASEAKALDDGAVPNGSNSGPRASLIVGFVALLLATAAASWFGFKKRFGRRTT